MFPIRTLDAMNSTARFGALACSIALVLAAVPAAAQVESRSPATVTPKIVISAGCQNGAVYSVASDATGNVAAAGYCGDPDADVRAFVAKADPTGTVLWTYRPGGSIRPTSLAFDSTGSILVAGQTRVGEVTIGTVLKIDSKGLPAWSRTVEPEQPGSTSCAGVATDADNSVYVSCGGATPPSGSVLAYRANGEQIWRRDGFDSAQALFVVNGKLFAASAAGVSILAQESGAMLSDVRLSGAGSVRVGQDGKIYVKSGDADGAIAIYDETLSPLAPLVLKSALGAARSYDYFDVDAGGNVYVFGAYYSSAELTGGGQYVAKFDANGNLVWQSVAEPAQSFSPSQSPSGLNHVLGAQLVSVSGAGKCFVSKDLHLVELPAQ